MGRWMSEAPMPEPINATTEAKAVFENLGYRQLTAWWGLRGIGAALRNRPATWGKKVRRDFD